MRLPSPHGTGIATSYHVRIRELLISVAAITILIALLSLADNRVRDYLGMATTTSVSHHVVEGTSRLESITIIGRQLVVDSGPLALLVVAATVLVACMLRT